MQEFTYNNITQHNRNRLLFKDATVDGLKTGFVSAAGYHLTATSQREGMRLVAVVMGAATPGVREREAMRLLNYGFRHYAMVQPFPDGQPLATVKVWKGVKDSLSLFPAEAATFLIAQAQKNSLRWEVSAPTEVTAPVEATQPLGEVIFYIGGEPKKKVALNSREDVAQAGLAKRAWQTVVRVDKINWRWVGGITGGIVLVPALFFFVARRRSSSRKFKSFS
jgi:D-alanyl-D-alanine carboxypeptidase (penicillin-binding protein 5/6)